MAKTDTASAPAPAGQTPSIGRTVIYHTHGHPLPGEWPAVVQRVAADGSLMLFVMGEKGHQLVSGIMQGVGVGQWSWPERV